MVNRSMFSHMHSGENNVLNAAVIIHLVSVLAIP